MILGKITFDNSVKYIPKTEQTRQTKQNTIRSTSLPRKQNKNLSQNNKNSIKMWQHKDLECSNEQWIVTFNQKAY